MRASSPPVGARVGAAVMTPAVVVVAVVLSVVKLLRLSTLVDSTRSLAV